MTYLYGGTILLVDLSSGQITREPTSSYAKSFLGGRGINIKLLYENISPGVDPLDPGNVLVFGVGPLGGTSISTGRTEITAKSPETKLLGSSNFGGFFGGELKYAGYDHIVVTGKSEKPVYLWIENEKMEIRDASSTWGKDTYQTPDIIRREVGNPEARILCIGPAGENRVRFATIQHELGHAAGRTGMGAVMGSKNLKAVAVRGTKTLKIGDPQRFLVLAAELEQEIKNHYICKEMAEKGTSPYQERLVEGADPTMPSQYAVYEKHKSKRAGCLGCPVQCMEHFEEGGSKSGVISCELYSTYTVQPRVHDSSASLECAILSQRYGIDCVSVGEMTNWLMELYENGVITVDDTDGTPMERGSAAAMREILDKITFRRGIGDILAEGVLAAAQEIGRGSEEYANQLKGLPMVEGHSPEWLPFFKGASLASAVGSRGDTMRSISPLTEWLEVDPDKAREIIGTEKAADPQEYEGKPELVAYFENAVCICDMVSTCKYLSHWRGLHFPFTPQYQAALFSAGTGTETSVETLFEYARKVRTLERAYEVSEGHTRDHDTLPKRFIDRPTTMEVLKGAILESEKLEEMKSKYYALRGWDVSTGAPTEETLMKYALDEVAQDLKKRGRLPAAPNKPEKKGE